jgi:NAD(P)-dependent dehydrogenase (short-subunit alcohol dehydrogenase family)
VGRGGGRWRALGTWPRAGACGRPRCPVNVLPVPRVEAEDIANAVIFLASDEGRYITGVALPVDADYALK